jgi:glucokinase
VASAAPAAVGVDIGGTKLAAGLVAADGTVLARARRDTPAFDSAALLAATAAVVDDLGGGGLPLGVGAAGLVDAAGAVRYAPNLGWRDYPLRDRLAERLGVAVTVDNDANVAAWGEFRCGAGAEAETSMVMLTVGTGVGGGLVVGGRLLRGANGMGAELGHLVVSAGGRRCPCGNLGCLEAYASGTAIGRAAEAAIAEGRVPAGSPLHDLDVLTGKTVTAVAAEGDASAVAAVAEVGRWLGVGIGSLVNALDPDIVVIGGGAMQAGPLLLDPARSSAEDHVIGLAHRTMPPIVPASLGDDAGVVGAALLAAGG